MTNLSRKTAKIFGETATTTGINPEIGQFGSAKAGTYIGTNDIDTIQGLPAWSNGWVDAVTPTQQFPTLPEMTGVHNVLSYQEAYLLQKGVAEWDSGTTYYTGDFCKGVGEGKLYVSLVDNNTNNAVTNAGYWEEFSSGASRNIGEIVTSTIPLIDAGLHLLDGALLQYGSYQAFIDYIADLYDSGSYTALFDTEANWQATVTLTGVCDKFVYDSNDNTVRLPKYGNQIFTKSPNGSVPVKGNGNALGLQGASNTYYWIGANSTLQPYYTTTNGDSGTSYSGSNGYSAFQNKYVGVSTDSSKSGLIADLSNITNYPLNCYYYIVIATSTKTQIQVDIDEIATDLNGKMDTDGANAVSSVKFADGQWVKSFLQIADTVTYPTSTAIDYDLSSYLPNDNYNYEVLISSRVITGTTSGNQIRLVLDTELANDMYMCGAITRTSSSAQGAGISVIPVGQNRIITVGAASSFVGTFTMNAVAYRRIGTNS